MYVCTYVDAKGVNQAMQFTGEVYEQIADLYTEQPKHDMIPALDILKEYLGLLEEFPDTQHLAKVSQLFIFWDP